jgi:hypothetical protein
MAKERKFHEQRRRHTITMPQTTFSFDHFLAERGSKNSQILNKVDEKVHPIHKGQVKILETKNLS